MEWEVWKRKYESIVERLELDPEMDKKAAQVLARIVGKRDLSGLRNILEGKECIVFGAGPSLVEDLERLSCASWLNKVLLTADGATSAVMEHKNPDVIVTDLDGNVDDQIDAWKKGAWVVVHAHGDNIEMIKEIVPLFDERIIGTIQVDKTAQLHNFGGFTDGDRAAFMAYELGAVKIYLAGMDLGKEIGEFTGQTERKQKIEKLEICEELLIWLAEEFGADLANITSGGKEIPNVPSIEVS